MRRLKHTNDTKANNHWARWHRATGWSGSVSLRKYVRHCDWNIDGRLKKNKILEKLIENESFF